MGFSYKGMQTREYHTVRSSTTKIYTDTEYSIFHKLISPHTYIIISDKNIFKTYPTIFKDCKYILIDDGEENKILATIEAIISKLIEFGVDRNSYIIGIGGGMVCDITGFVAHIYMRGTRFGLIPTTLLSQIDASIGGKNGINFSDNKNFIGSFDNPDFIISDLKFIDTISEEQFKSGLGEIIKYALIGNKEILSILQDNTDCILNHNKTCLGQLTSKSIAMKMDIVENDPLDKGYRHILNFGHTFGHTIEIIDKIPHGIAVVKGMNVAIDLSVKLELLDKQKAADIKKLLIDLGYDISYQLRDEHIRLVCNDKKKNGDSIKLVLLNDICVPTIKEIQVSSIPTLVK